MHATFTRGLLSCAISAALVTTFALTGCSFAAASASKATSSQQTASTPSLGTQAAASDEAVDAITARATEILGGMTLKQKVSQMFLVYAPTGKAVKAQKKYQFGGYVFFANDFSGQTKKSFKKLAKKCQKASNVKMLMAVDEEGGTVVRVSMYKAFRKSKFQSPRQLYNAGGWEKIKSDTREKSKLLKGLGLNTNLAPVADTPYESSDYLYQRSFSTKAKRNAKYIKTVVNIMNKQGEIACLKHFPGYGNNGNTHTSIIRDKRSLKTFETRDLKPFQAGIKAGVPMIMMSHNIVKAFDAKNPVSISKAAHTYLRKTMGFEGVIVTDGLGMQGVRKKVGSDSREAIKAVKAGNDMLCTGYGMATKSQVKAVLKAVKSGKISKKRINTSVLRILKMKLAYGIIK